MLAIAPATTAANVDINSLVARSPPAPSPDNASTTSKTSTSSRARDDTTGSARTSSVTTASTPATLPRIPVESLQQTIHQPYTIMQTAHYPAPYPPPTASHYPPMGVYPSYQPSSTSDLRLPQPIPITRASGQGAKRLAPPHPAESPAKKKQSKWTADEDASIIELRGNGMKWEDISRHLPGRSAISCRLRFQNYLERRSEWDEEKKNKLARLYERCDASLMTPCSRRMLTRCYRFKKDMWEKISKEMQLPWRAAEAMHWQIGEVEMAQRANVPVFHLASQQASHAGAMSDRASSTSPSSATGRPSTMSYSHMHNHSLPQIAIPQPQPNSPVQVRLRRNSSEPFQSGHAQSRRRADSVRSATASSASRTLLPPVGELAGPSAAPMRYLLPPVVTSEPARR